MSIFPSENTWITPRTKDVKITTDNCMLILPKKISHIEQGMHLSVVCQNPSYVNYTFRRKFLQQKGTKTFCLPTLQHAQSTFCPPQKKKYCKTGLKLQIRIKTDGLWQLSPPNVCCHAKWRTAFSLTKYNTCLRCYTSFVCLEQDMF